MVTQEETIEMLDTMKFNDPASYLFRDIVRLMMRWLDSHVVPAKLQILF